MAIGFHGAFITIDSTWLQFKAQVASKSLSIQYYDDDTRYVIFALDDNVILYLTFIYKGTVPDTIILAGYSQGQNDSDKSDFVSNFLPGANTAVGGIFTDKSSFTYGTGTASPAGGVYQDTSPSLTAGQAGTVRLTANRAFHINLRDASGNEKLGQLSMANSIPIAIASDQSSFTVAATQSSTWTVQPGNTANTTPWLVTDSSDGTVGAGTAAAKSSLAGIVFNTALPALTNGQQAAMQADSSGRLLIGSIASALPTGANTIGAVTQASGPWTQNITQFGSSAVVTGTGASGSGIPRVTIANDSNILATQSGTWTVAQGTAAALSGGWPVKVTDGTNTLPTMDTVGRAGFHKITDGTNTATVKAASTAAAASDQALVVAISPNNSVAVAPVSDVAPATINITANDAASTTTSVANSQSFITGSPTANSSAVFTLSSKDTVLVQVTGVWVGTLQCEASFDGGTTYTPRRVHQVGVDTAGLTFTSNFAGNVNVAGCTHFRVRGTPWTSGTATVLVTETLNTSIIDLANAVRLTDGTNTIGTLFNTLHADPNGDRRTIHSNATITSSGSTVVTWNGHSEWYLIINIKNAPTGTTPTITFNIDQVDPIDNTTVLTGIGDVKNDTSGSLNAAGVTILEIAELVSDAVKISWVVTGSSPSFTGVNVAWCGHGSGNAIEGQADEGTALHDGPLPIAGVDGSRIVRACKVDTAGNLLVNTANAGGANGIAFGDIPLSAVSSNNAIRRTTYTEQSSNAQRSVKSANANDTSAGTGARTIKITYYDSTGAGPSTETITMNGTAAVNTVSTTICYIEKMEVLTVGSGLSNAGIITLFTTTGGGGSAIGTIAAGDNQTFWAHHYTPTGKTTFITSVSATVNGGAGQFFIRAITLNASNQVEKQVSDIIRESPQAATSTRNYGAPIQVVGPARVLAYVTTEANTSLTYRAAFDFYDQ